MHNLEKHPLRRGMWLGHHNGFWRITAQRDKRGRPYRWDAVRQGGVGFVSGRTLRDVSRKLED